MIEHVSGRGRMPALRIADQPYSILATTNFAAMRWFDGEAGPRNVPTAGAGLKRLHRVLQEVRSDWSGSFSSLAYLGRKDADPHALLMQALGLNPASVEYDQRYAESFLQH